MEAAASIAPRAECGAIYRKTDAITPVVHADGIAAHALADDIERNLAITKGAPVTRERIARASFPVSPSLARSKRLPVKRSASTRTRTATAPMSATERVFSELSPEELRGLEVAIKKLGKRAAALIEES